MDMSLRLPKTAKAWTGLGIVVATLLLGIWPVIALFNKPILVLGMPLIMVWSAAMLVITTIAMVLLNVLSEEDR